MGTVIRRIPIYPGGPELHVPPDWTEAQIAAVLAQLRQALGEGGGHTAPAG